MYLKKLMCESCGAQLNSGDVHTDMLGISKITCAYCGTTTLLSMGYNRSTNKTVKPYVVVLSIDAESANVRLNGVERVVKSSELMDLLISDRVEFDMLSRAKVARIFNINLDALADAEEAARRKREERLSDFLANL